jgi:hypothetical protein
MKSWIMTVALSAAMALTVFAAEQTWTGAISDKMCRVSHRSMGNGKMSDRECTLACTKGGASYVFAVDGKVYQLTNHDADLRTHAGHTVNLMGELKGDTIRVSKIEMPKP